MAQGTITGYLAIISGHRQGVLNNMTTQEVQRTAWTWDGSSVISVTLLSLAGPYNNLLSQFRATRRALGFGGNVNFGHLRWHTWVFPIIILMCSPQCTWHAQTLFFCFPAGPRLTTEQPDRAPQSFHVPRFPYCPAVLPRGSWLWKPSHHVDPWKRLNKTCLVSSTVSGSLHSIYEFTFFAPCIEPG